MAYTIQYISEEDQYQDVFRKINDNFKYLVGQGLLTKTDVAKLMSGQDVTLSFTLDLHDKIYADLNSNPNYTATSYATTLLIPTAFGSESVQQYYDSLSKLDGNLCVNNTSASNVIIQRLVKFNIIDTLTNALGSGYWVAVGATTLADKIKFIQTRFQNGLTYNVWGFGNIGTTYKLNLARWNKSAWVDTVSHTANTATQLSLEVSDVTNLMDTTGNADMNVYTSVVTSGTSLMSLDYVSAEFSIDLKLSDFIYTKNGTDQRIIEMITGTNSTVSLNSDMLAGLDGTVSRFVKDATVVNNYFVKSQMSTLYFSGVEGLRVVGDSGVALSSIVSVNPGDVLNIKKLQGANRGSRIRVLASQDYPYVDMDENKNQFKVLLQLETTVAELSEATVTIPEECKYALIVWSVVSDAKNMSSDIGFYIAKNATASDEYYPAPEDYGVVHGQPNLLTGTSSEWVEYSFSGWAAGKNFDALPIGDTLKVGDKIYLAAEIDNTYGSVGARIPVTFVGAENPYSFTSTISVGSSGLSEGSFTIPEGCTSFRVDRLGKVDGVTSFTAKVREHKLIKGAKTAYDDWTPHQSDSGLTIVNNGIVVLGNNELTKLATKGKTVKAETNIVGKNPELFIDFNIISQISSKFPYVFKGLTSTAEKLAKLQTILTSVTAKVSYKGTSYASTNLYSCTNSNWASTNLLENTSTSLNEKSLEFTNITSAQLADAISNEGIMKWKVFSAPSDGITKSTVELNYFKLILVLNVDGKELIFDAFSEIDNLKNYLTKEESSANVIDHVDQLEEKIDTKLNNKADKTQVSQLEEKIDTKLNNKADKTQVAKVEDMISKMPSATPRETFASLSALQTKYPNGDTSAMIVLESDGKTGYVYLWTGTVWQKGALYQSQGLQERSVTLPILADKAVAREKTDFLTPVFVNYANFSAIEDNGCYVDSGVWTARTDVLSMSLSLEIGATYVKKWFHITEMGGTFTTFWDASGTFISGTNTSEFTVPTNTKTTKIAVFKSVRAKTALLKKGDKYLFTDYNNIPQVNNMEDTSIERRKTDWYTDTDVVNNLYDPATRIDGYYYNQATGVVTNVTNGWGTTPKIKVKVNTEYVTKWFSDQGETSNKHVTFWKDNGTDAGLYLSGTMAGAGFTTPAECDFVRLSVHKTNNAKAMLLEKHHPYKFFDQALLVSKENIDPKLLLIDERLANKKWTVLGDSLSSNGDYAFNAWIKILAEKYNGTVANYGISGTTIAHSDRHLWDYHFAKRDASAIGYVEADSSTWESGTCFYERIDELDESADFVFFFGGTNDNSAKKGIWNGTDMTCLLDATNQAFSRLKQKYGTKPIICILPPQGKTAVNGNVLDAKSSFLALGADKTMSLQLRVEAIRLVAKKYSIPCIDLFNESGISGASTGFYLDSTHLNQTGQNIIASKVEQKLMSVLFN